MSFFKRLFGSKKETTANVVQENKPKENSLISKKEVEAYDKQFVVNFTKNGGKFIYTLDLTAINEALSNIIAENQWLDVGCTDANLNHLLKNRNLNLTTEFLGQDFVFVPCEYLVADTGAIVFSSRQLGENRMDKLPDNFIIYSRTSQLVRNLDEAMRSLKNKYKNNFPSNITTLKTFSAINNEDTDFRNYGSVSKNVYLLLLEDLQT